MTEEEGEEEGEEVGEGEGKGKEEKVKKLHSQRSPSSSSIPAIIKRSHLFDFSHSTEEQDLSQQPAFSNSSSLLVVGHQSSVFSPALKQPLQCASWSAVSLRAGSHGAVQTARSRRLPCTLR
eukprot:NODE_7531_length_467_cov_22.811005_g7085_i0.p1 GENE.NODE_7531_length_467_cov_22.811005_g7085_i0~~NODE_7531_length_467_cov_22.811005_g7085_i0.p1  ORF type:complete len:122 (+),score=27.80 NODE_7531_length_467_cov_22.811005_g7085_i0:100-465(+)